MPILDNLINNYGSQSYNQNDLNYMNNLLMGEVSKGNPMLSKLRNAGLSKIRKSTERGNRNVAQRLAQLGISSAAGANLYGENASNESQSIAELEGNYANTELQARNNAISQLLGIQNMKRGIFESDRGYGLQLGSAEEQKYQWGRDFDLRRRQYEDQAGGSIFGDILGLVGGGLLGGITGGLGSSLGKKIGDWI